VLLVVFALLAVASCHVFNMGVHKHKAVSLKAGPSVFPLQGNINQYAEFFINISIGTPPQILRVQVDTGSTDLVVFATGCSECPTAPNVTYFNPQKSKTNDPIDCQDDSYDCDVNNCWQDQWCPLEIEYGGGGSINGYAANDIITLGPLSVKYASFGLIQEIDGPFENLGIDGCWGFAYEDLSSWGDGPVMDHFAEELKLYDSFSLCLTNENPVMEIGTDYQGNDAYDWTKVSGDDWYSVEMEDLFVNGQSVGVSKFDLNSQGVIADSGTTLFIVSKKVMDAVQTHLVSLCSSTNNLPGVCNSTATETLFNGYCFPMNQSQINMFPNISTSLKDMKSQIVIPPQAYLWEGAGIEGVFCFGLQYVPDTDGSLPLILGDIVLSNYHVVFDRKENMLGWADLSTCPTA